MRLLVRMASAMTSMRAPARPFSENSCVATSMMSAIVRSGSLVRGAAALGCAARRGFCTVWFIAGEA